MTELLHLGIGLILMVLANIFFGSLIAIIDGSIEWSWKTFFKGILKGLSIIVGCVSIYYAGTLNPELIAVKIANQELTLIMALTILFTLAIGVYAVKAFSNLAKLFNVETSITKTESQSAYDIGYDWSDEDGTN